MEKSNKSAEYFRVYPDYENSKGGIVLIYDEEDGVLYHFSLGGIPQVAIMDPSTVGTLFINGCLNIIYLTSNNYMYMARPHGLKQDLKGGDSFLLCRVYNKDTAGYDDREFIIYASENNMWEK